MSKVKLEIKNKWTGSVLFEYEKENNTVKETLLEAIRSGADLCGADLCDADLRGADLYGADLRDADLCGANLCGADLCGADLCGADLRGADLRDANLCGADLCGADLRGADLRDADLCGAVIDCDDKKDGYGNTDEIVKQIKDNSNLIPTVVYENHDVFSSKCGSWWRNLIIIREWKIKEKKESKEVIMTITEIEERLGIENLHIKKEED